MKQTRTAAIIEDLPLVVGHIPGVAASDQQVATGEQQWARAGELDRWTACPTTFAA